MKRKNYKMKLKQKIELWNEYHNPFYVWWKCRKYFTFPSIKTYIGKLTWFFGFPIRTDYLNKFVDFRISALGWKDKYDSPRHEENPLFVLKFFRWKMQLEWTTNDCLSDVIYWETILDVVYYGKSMRDAIDSNTWDDLHNKKTNLETLGYFH